jgi:hypothetical protein
MPLPVKKIVLNLDELLDYQKLKKSIPNIAQSLKKLHLKIKMKLLSYFVTFVEELASLKNGYQDK